MSLQEEKVGTLSSGIAYVSGLLVVLAIGAGAFYGLSQILS